MATNQDSTLDVIKRFAIDSSGRLGSLYDAYRDCILGQLNVRSTQQPYQSVNSTQCQCHVMKSVKKQNLLNSIGVEKDLQLSILVNLAPKLGIASLMDFSGPMNEFTRILYFHYVHSEEQLSDNMSEIQQSIQSLRLQTSATHIITGVSWGYYVIIILQLSSDQETVQRLDDALEKFRMTLENESGNRTLDTNDENLLGEISNIQIYSNVPDLTRIAKLHEVGRHINQLKYSISNYPMTYNLRSIAYSHSGCTGQGITFVSLPSAVIDFIQKHVFQMLCEIKDLEILLNDTLPKSLGGYLKGQLYDAHQQWSSINKEYIREIDRLSKLLIDCQIL
jgi:hypothetical protein